jgi:hypothetical protein
MSLELVVEVWEALQTHIDLNDRGDAADTLVTYLIENNYEIEDIKSAFSDKIINTALKGYAEEHFNEDEDEDYEEYEEDIDEDDWN